MITEANVKDLYLVLIALSALCVGLGAMLMWHISERQHDRHRHEVSELIRHMLLTRHRK